MEDLSLTKKTNGVNWKLTFPNHPYRMLRIGGERPSRPELLEMEKAAEAENVQADNIIANLTKLSEDTDMPITQENGQRCYGPPRDWQGSPPPKGSEVFVGKLPRDVYEPHLVPIFGKVGRIYRIRLMMDFSGTNRGYCFVQYATPEEAHKAIRELNDFEISKGRRIGVLKSVDNCRLFFGGLPKDKSEEEIFQEISQHTDGVRRVIAYPSAEDKTKNRGFAFVEYESHKTAAMARRKMIPGNITLWGQDVCVDWAEPEPEVDPEIMNKVQNLYVRNLMLSTTEEKLCQIFNQVSSNGVEKVKKIKDYAFVHFNSREQADAARMALNKKNIDGAIVEISWAKPVDKVTSTKPKSPKQRWTNGGPRSYSSSPQNRSNNGSRPFVKEISPFMHQFPSVFPFGLPVSPLGPSVDPSNQHFYGYSPNVPTFHSSAPKSNEAYANPVETLTYLCRVQGWMDPVYIPMTVGEGVATMHRVDILIHTNLTPGYFEFLNEQCYASEEYAKAASAEKVLRQLTTGFSRPPIPSLDGPMPFVN